jgi:hypothetical protein
LRSKRQTGGNRPKDIRVEGFESDSFISMLRQFYPVHR